MQHKYPSDGMDGAQLQRYLRYIDMSTAYPVTYVRIGHWHRVVDSETGGMRFESHFTKSTHIYAVLQTVEIREIMTIEKYNWLEPHYKTQ